MEEVGVHRMYRSQVEHSLEVLQCKKLLVRNGKSIQAYLYWQKAIPYDVDVD